MPKVIAINFEISPLYTKRGYTTCLSSLCVNPKCCWCEAKQNPVEILVPGHQRVSKIVRTLSMYL